MGVPLKGGRGEASAVIKCKMCSRENSIDILPDTITSYDMKDNNKLKTIVVFDCRGLEPVDFSHGTDGRYLDGRRMRKARVPSPAPSSLTWIYLKRNGQI